MSMVDFLKILMTLCLRRVDMIFRVVLLYLFCFAFSFVFFSLLRLTNLQEKIKIVKQTLSWVGISVAALILFVVVYFFGNIN